MSLSSPIRALSDGFTSAHQRMQQQAAAVVAREASNIEASAKSVHDPIVVALDGTTARIGGTERRGVNQELSTAPALAGLDMNAAAAALASGLADAGASVIL